LSPLFGSGNELGDPPEAAGSDIGLEGPFSNRSSGRLQHNELLTRFLHRAPFRSRPSNDHLDLLGRAPTANPRIRIPPPSADLPSVSPHTPGTWPIPPAAVSHRFGTATPQARPLFFPGHGIRQSPSLEPGFTLPFQASLFGHVPFCPDVPAFSHQENIPPSFSGFGRAHGVGQSLTPLHQRHIVPTCKSTGPLSVTQEPTLQLLSRFKVSPNHLPSRREKACRLFLSKTVEKLLQNEPPKLQEAMLWASDINQDLQDPDESVASVLRESQWKL
jgi:hypothetical protein